MDIPKLDLSKVTRKNSINTSVSYNTWYIKPKYRLKLPIKNKYEPIDKDNDEFLYNKLYDLDIPKANNPFKKAES